MAIPPPPPGTVPVAQQPAAPSSAGTGGYPTLTPLGPPHVREPAPQTAPQATHDVLENTRLNQQIDSTPISNVNTAANTARTQQTTQQSDSGGHNFTDEHSLSQQYAQNPSVQAYQTVLPIYRAAQRAGDTPAGDLQLVYAFARIMDPLTGVREGEAASVAGAAAPDQRIQGYMDYLHGHGQFTPELRQQLRAEMAARGSSLDQDYNRVRSDYIANARRYGFDPHAIVGTHAAIPYREQMGLDNHNVQIQAPGGHGDVAFWDDPQRPAEYAPRDPTADVAHAGEQAQQLFDSGATREQLDAFAAQHGLGPWGTDMARAIQYRDRGGRGARILAPPRPPERQMPQGDPNSTSEAVGANIRGATNAATAGLDHPIVAGINALRGDGTFQENLWRENEYDNANQQAHPYATIAGNIEGALAVPTGAGGAGRSAATEAIRAGLGRAEAVSAARGAVGRRLAGEGALYGVVHGTATGEGGLGDRLKNGGIESAVGALTGFAGRFGPGFGRTSPRASALPPLVDPQTGRLNALLEGVSPAERVAAAQRHGIDLPLGAATDRGGAIIEKGLDVSPVSAGIMNDSRRAVDKQATNALESVAGRYGNARTMDEAGTALQAGAQNWIHRATVAARDGQPSIVSKAYDAIPIRPETPASLDNTRGTLARMTDVFRSNPDMRSIFQNGRLRRYLDAITPPHDPADELGTRDTAAGLMRTVGRTTEQQPGSLSWQDLKQFRSIIGEEIGAERFSDSPARSQLRGLYGALSEDMRATAAARGPNALRTFERANNLNRNVETRIEDALVRILGDNSKNNPEAAAAAVQTIARSGRRSANLQQLGQIRASLMKGGEWDDVAAALIRLGGQPAAGEGRGFNPQTFLNWYSGMTEDARRLLFADRPGTNTGRAELRKALDSFVAVTQRLAGTNALRNTSNTTPGMIGAGAVGGAGAVIWNGLMSPLTAIGSAAGLAGNYYLAKVWTNPGFVRWATGYTKMAGGASRSRFLAPSTRQRMRQRLGNLARSSPDIADAIYDLDHRLFGDSTPADAPPATPAQ